MKKSLLTKLAIVLAFTSCSPKVVTNIQRSFPVDNTQECGAIAVLEAGQALPAGSEVFGTVKIGDTGFTTKGGDYASVLERAKEEARKAGGNAIRITEHKSPDGHSTIHRINAEILKLSDEAFFMNPVQGSSVSESSETIIPEKKEYSKFRIGIEAGVGYNFAKISSSVPMDFRSYAKKLRLGYVYSANAAWFFHEYLGVGAQYKAFRSSNSENVSVKYNDGSTRTGRMKDNICISFAGPTFCYRGTSADGRRILSTEIGLGYMHYMDDGVLIDPVKTYGSTLGYLWDVSYEYAFSKRFSVGAKLSWISGSLYEMTVEQNNVKTTKKLDDEFVSLSHADLTIGLRVNF